MLVLLCWLIAIPPVVALTIFSLETLFGTSPLKAIACSGRMPTTRILIPAHNEAGTIEATLDRLASIVSDQVRLLVVADNCSDATAMLVRQAGHDVIERTDADKKGKGYALAFGRDHLCASPPECVIVFDADCESDAASIAALVKRCVNDHAVVQSRYILIPDRTAAPKVQISNFAFWIKNVVRQRGAFRLRGAAVLTGTGMAFPWRIFDAAPLATANIVEDLALGIYLTQIGEAPVYLEQSTVTSAAASETATLAQRARWEHGFLATAKSHGLFAIWNGVRSRNRKLVQLGFHLLVPPLALLLFASFATLVFLGASTLMTGYWPAFLALAMSTGVAIALVFVNWLIEGRYWLSPAALVRLPLYLLWKIPMYLRFAKGDTPGWTRTARPNDAEEQ